MCSSDHSDRVTNIYLHVVLKVYVSMNLQVLSGRVYVCGVGELHLATVCAEQMEWRGILAAALRVK